MFISQVFQSYQDNGKLIMKDLCNGVPFRLGKSPATVEFEPAILLPEVGSTINSLCHMDVWSRKNLRNSCNTSLCFICSWYF